MMDPTRGDDLAKRMRRRSQINIGFGMVFLFAVLIFFKTVSVIFGNALFQDLIVLIWIIILWGGYSHNHDYARDGHGAIGDRD